MYVCNFVLEVPGSGYQRCFNLLMLQLTFVTFVLKGLAEKTHHYTLLDGEMIIDTLPDSHKQERRYLIYDMIAINHVSVIEVWFITHPIIQLNAPVLPFSNIGSYFSRRKNVFSACYL